jgi:leader peptidase (prepilin peptidase)/N-methyltransferase
MNTTSVLIVCAVLGPVIGSFLTVVVDRVPRGASIVAPPSACGSCGARLTVVDLIPIVSWILLRGRCRRCGTAIGVEPVVVEVATTGLFIVFALEFGADPALPSYLVLAAALVALVWIDIREFRLPREITYTALALGAPALAVAAFIDDDPGRLTRAALGAVIALAVMAAIHLVSRGGMGDGDVRLAPLLGFYLGDRGLAFVPMGLFAGFVFGAVVGLAVIAAGRGDRKTALPFGPFLATGTVVTIVAGQDLIDRFGWAQYWHW